MKKDTNNTTPTNESTTTPATAEKNTTPANNNEKNEGKKTMKTNGKKKTTAKKTTPAPAERNTLPGNIEQAKKTTAGDLANLEKLLNTPTTAGDKIAMLTTKITTARGTVGKDLANLNKLTAIEYYRKTPLFDIVKNGDNVPAFVIDESISGNKYTLKLKKTKVYPTLSGMKSAGVIDEDVVSRVDTLRRVTAFVKSDKTARVFLTGDIENKKDCPTEKVAEMIESLGEISKNKVRALMTRVFKDLTGETYKKEIMPKLYEEFETYVTKRARKWGERNMVGKSTACDMALEFAWMYFNGKTEFKYNGENA